MQLLVCKVTFIVVVGFFLIYLTILTEPNDHHCDVYAFCDHFESKYEIKHEFEEDDQMNSNDSLGSSSNGQSCSSELSNFQARTTFSYVILPFIFRDVYYSILLLTEGFEIM